MLAGKKVDAALLGEVAKTVAGETNPIDDVRAQASYRRRASEALAKDLLGRALAVG
jgi:CO/xanthine dehydrogenase FAD-binding subunit